MFVNYNIVVAIGVFCVVIGQLGLGLGLGLGIGLGLGLGLDRRGHRSRLRRHRSVACLLHLLLTACTHDVLPATDYSRR